METNVVLNENYFTQATTTSQNINLSYIFMVVEWQPVIIYHKASAI
jgi:hypothetical protein